MRAHRRTVADLLSLIIPLFPLSFSLSPPRDSAHAMRRHASALALAALLGGSTAASVSPNGGGLAAGPRRALRDNSRMASADDLPALLQPLAAPPAPAHSAGLFAVSPASAEPSAEYLAHVKQAGEAARVGGASPAGLPAGHEAARLAPLVAAKAATAAAAAPTPPLLIPLPPSAAQAATPRPSSPLSVRPPVHEDPGLALRGGAPVQQGGTEAEGEAATPASTTTVAGEQQAVPANVAAASGFAAAVSAPAGTQVVVAPQVGEVGASVADADAAPGQGGVAPAGVAPVGVGGRLVT